MQPMQSTQFILAGALRGAGDTRWPLYSTAIGIWGIRVVLVHVFIAMGMGALGLHSCVTKLLEPCSFTLDTNRVLGSTQKYEELVR